MLKKIINVKDVHIMIIAIHNRKMFLYLCVLLNLAIKERGFL